MPELPEVEAAARELAAAVEGKVVRRAAALHPALVRTLPEADARALAGRTIRRVRRRGKHQLLELDDGRTLHVHFRMSGDWAVGAVADDPPRHARALLELADGTRVALVDPRALSTMRLLAPDEDPLPRLAPDADAPEFGVGALAAALAGKRSAIKPALLDQRVVAGIGNIYAAEALWQARISPRAVASRISRARIERLHAAILTVIERARRAPSRYYGESREPRFQVYDREGEPCRRCGTSIRRIVQTGRSTYFCPRCQRS